MNLIIKKDGMNTQNIIRKLAVHSSGLLLLIIPNCYANDQLIINPLDFIIETVNSTTIDDVLSVKDNQFLNQACQNWHLNKQQITQFFLLSEQYQYSPYSQYYQVPCNINGTLRYQNEIWQFTINGGATGNWQREGSIKYFGCRDEKCESLVIIPTDDMKG